MYQQNCIKVIIPARNEEQSISHVLQAIPAWVDEVLVVNNGSTDQTAAVAARYGAGVIDEPRPGYGRACLAGIAALGPCDIVVFIDADFSDYPEEMEQLVRPIIEGHVDMVIGSRTQNIQARTALTPQQRFGNRLACDLMRIIWGGRFTDLGPFRAIRHAALRQLNMQDTNFGWTVEMQIKAVRAGLVCCEVPVQYRQRIGISKISGTVRGVIGAGTKILWTIFRQAVQPTAIYPPGRDRLIVFTRFPLPGRAKTRLIPAVGPVAAADLQRQMTEQTLATARDLSNHSSTRIEIRYDGGNHQQIRRWLGEGLLLRSQSTGDLGRRLQQAAQQAWGEGSEKIVFIGTDCPAVTADHLHHAFVALNDHDLVLGPSTDGGYWLIGMCRPLPVFDRIDWGGPDVLQQTLTLAQNQNLSYTLLETLSDIDEPDDLGHLPSTLPLSHPWLSVIIPTLNEARFLEWAIRSIQGDGREIIVADGGSTDRTVEIARRFRATVVESPPGRARQMNVAARIARGRVLLFLHGDTCIRRQTSIPLIARIFTCLSDPRMIGGYFRFRTDHHGLYFRLLEKIVCLRNQFFHMPYGDQAIFIRRDVFEAIGGYPDVPIAEDILLAKAMQRRGRLCRLPHDAITSARRWRAIGPVKNTLLNMAILAGLTLDLPESWLKQLYHYPLQK